MKSHSLQKTTCKSVQFDEKKDVDLAYYKLINTYNATTKHTFEIAVFSQFWSIVHYPQMCMHDMVRISLDSQQCCVVRLAVAVVL